MYRETDLVLKPSALRTQNKSAARVKYLMSERFGRREARVRSSD